MKVYIVEDVSDWGDTRKILGVFKQKKDAIDMCLESNINPNSIEEHEVIE